MLVLLRRNFNIEGHRYRRDPRGTEIDDKYAKVLPSDAKILVDPKGKAVGKLDKKELMEAKKATRAEDAMKPIALSQLAAIKKAEENVDIDI